MVNYRPCFQTYIVTDQAEELLQSTSTWPFFGLGAAEPGAEILVLSKIFNFPSHREPQVPVWNRKRLIVLPQPGESTVKISPWIRNRLNWPSLQWIQGVQISHTKSGATTQKSGYADGKTGKEAVKKPVYETAACNEKANTSKWIKIPLTHFKPMHTVRFSEVWVQNLFMDMLQEKERALLKKASYHGDFPAAKISSQSRHLCKNGSKVPQPL